MEYIGRLGKYAKSLTASIMATAVLAGAPAYAAESYTPSHGIGVEYIQKQTTKKPVQKKKPVKPKKPSQAKPVTPKVVTPKTYTIEQKIEAYFNGLRASRYLNPTDRLYVTVEDIDQGIPVVSINENTPIMAASTIKDFIMLAYYDQLSKGEIKARKNDEALLDAMIKRSSNPATNVIIINRLGGAVTTNSILENNYSYFDETEVRETIPRNERTYRNMTSTSDLNLFYKLLWHNSFQFSRELHERMKKHLSDENDHTDRLFDNTCIPGGVKVWNKTGTVYGQVSDSGILQFKTPHGDHRYAISVAIEDTTKPHEKRNPKKAKAIYKNWARRRANVIRSISEGVYDYMATKYNGSYFCKEHGGKHLGGRQ